MQAETADPRFDTPAGCADELATVNREIAGFAHEWARDAGELKETLKRYDRLHRAALRGIKGEMTVAQRDAAAHAAVEEVDPGLAERIEELEGNVEQHKTHFKTLERRASNAQSMLGFQRDEAKMNRYGGE